MNYSYELFVIQILCYKLISLLIFKHNCLVSKSKNIEKMLKIWNFSFTHIIYYVIFVIAFVEPLTKPINNFNLFIGITFTIISLILMFLSKKLYNFIRFPWFIIDFIFLFGLAISTQSFLILFLNLIYAIHQIIIIIKIDKKLKENSQYKDLSKKTKLIIPFVI